jgi:predicted Zn finger-like uncharacterized protein
MKFLCPNCKAKYRIGPEKMVGRQAAKIRCRKCEYLIQIAYRPNSDEFDVTANPPSIAPPPPAAPPPLRAPKAGATSAGQPVTPGPATASNAGAPAPRARLVAPGKDEGSGSKKPTAAVPGLPGLGSPKSRTGAALLSDPSGLARRPLAPLPPPPVPPLSSAGLGGSPSSPMAAPAAASASAGLGVIASPPPPSPPPGLGLSHPAASPARAGSTQLADQFRESVQAGGVTEDLPQEGWFVGVNGVPLGPIPLGDLRELAMAGHIDRRSLVWRDGQAEWRPLGKFAGLARVIDDGASPALPRAEPVGAARTNGANGHMASSPTGAAHVATGFDVPRADAGERPSAWGDLDDEDDEDEQPTTVKGRVSVMPAGGAPPSQVALAAPPPPAVSSPGAPNPFGVTSAMVPPPALAPNPPAAPAPMVSLPPAAMESASPVSIISAMPDSMGDMDDELRPPRRSKWYLIAVAIVFAFVLGAIVTHLMRASSPEKTSSDAPSSDALSSDARGSRDSRGAAEVELGSQTTGVTAARERGSQPEAITAALRPRDVERSDDMRSARSALVPEPSVGMAEPSASKTSATGSLLSGLGSPRAPGPGLARGERAAGTGLDATAIQRTVRRHSPGVRQNCWLRAIEARPPGVPTSVKLTATITVDAGGHVQGVAVTGAPRGYPSLSRCIEGAVKSWQFPRSGAQTITNVPFMFMGR